jgi:broad specificity phosphatase PhoE
LQRISTALRTLIDIAAYETDSGSLVAISHSVYLRLLLGAVQDVAIFSSTSPQANCGINVIDFPHPTTSTIMNQFGETNESSIPKGNVVRVNEKRHLSLVPLE